MFQLDKIISYKLVNVESKSIFDLNKDELIMVTPDDIKYMKSNKFYKEIEESLNILYYAGHLKIFAFPKKGDECYFWNGKDKMKSLAGRKSGPFIATYDGMEDGKFCAEDCIMKFNYCEPINNIW